MQAVHSKKFMPLIYFFIIHNIPTHNMIFSKLFANLNSFRNISG